MISAKEASLLIDTNIKAKITNQLNILRQDFSYKLSAAERKFICISADSNHTESVGEFRRELHSLGYTTDLAKGPPRTVFIEVTWE
jgi:hypothetical protein